MSHTSTPSTLTEIANYLSAINSYENVSKMEGGDLFVSMTARTHTHYYESRRRVTVEWLLVDVFKCSCLLSFSSAVFFLKVFIATLSRGQQTRIDKVKKPLLTLLL